MVKKKLVKKKPVKKIVKKVVKKKDYAKFASYIMKFVDKPVEEKLDALDKGIIKYNLNKSEGKEIFNTKIKEFETENIKNKKRTEKEKKEKEEQEKKDEEISISGPEVEEQEEELDEGSEDKKAKEKLKKEMKAQEIEGYDENKINWLEGDFYDSWDKTKGHMKKLWNHKKEYSGEPPKWYFLAHSKDKIRGKPQLIEPTQKNIPLVRLAIKREKDKGQNGDDYVNESGYIDIQSFYFFDERYDKRYNGYLEDTFSLYFYMYQIITKEDKRYFILTQEKLPNEICDFEGMLIEMADLTELSRSLKIPSISGFFIMKKANPSVKIISKEELIKYTKDNKISEQDWLDTLAYHPLGTMNNFPLEVEMLRSSFTLSGKVDGWGPHLGIIGPPGTCKSMGHIESLSYKFEEEPRIAEGSAWTIKGLGPSFKQSIADVGYFAKAHRIGFIDEIGKMVEKELNKHESSSNNILGDFNFLLEHKKRLVGSGNTGEIETQATAKFMFVTNPISNMRTIGKHIGAIDPTFMSRIFWWVQDREEQELVLSKRGVIRNPPKPLQDISPLKSNPPTTYTSISLIENREKGIVLKKLWGKVKSREDFLTLFDSCYSFVCEIEDSKVEILCNVVTALAKEPMKSSVWKPRAYHHVKLLVDGLCKHRCLFKDYDVSFVAKPEDYDLAERILVRMVNSWEIDLQPKEEV